MNTQQAKSHAYATARSHGVTIDYEVGYRHWTVNVNAPEGRVFSGGEHSLVTEWMTKPNADFWLSVAHDIEQCAPHLEEDEEA